VAVAPAQSFFDQEKADEGKHRENEGGLDAELQDTFGEKVDKSASEQSPGGERNHWQEKTLQNSLINGNRENSNQRTNGHNEGGKDDPK